MKLCLGASVISTDYISVCDRLSNSSIGIVNHLHRRLEPFRRTIYLKYDDPKVGNSLKDVKLRGKLKECITITAREMYCIAERFLTFGYAITGHKLDLIKLGLGRIVNNLYLRVNFMPYFPLPKIVMKGFIVEF